MDLRALFYYTRMTKQQVIERMALDGFVEEVVRNVTLRDSISYDLADLVQIVYLSLLQQPEAKIVRLWETGAMRYYVSRIVMTQYRSPRSTYAAQVTRFRERMQPVEGMEDVQDG